MADKSVFDAEWIKKEGIPIVESYDGNLTLRSLHYRLVALGMTNDLLHYKKVTAAMTVARWAGEVDFDDFKDHERETLGETRFDRTNPKDAADEAKETITFWTTYYRKNRWENQYYYPEVFIEKKALQGVFEQPCSDYDIALNPCKGYPSLTFLWDARNRFQNALDKGKQPIILYFGDYDCSGEDIPRSIQENIEKMGTEVIVRRIALMEEQVVKWKLPPAPTKQGDTRSGAWEGLGQVELDAVEPKKIVNLLRDAIEDIFDRERYKDLLEQQKSEIKVYKKELRNSFDSLLEDEDEEDDE